MPVYDISGTPLAALAAVDIVVDDGALAPDVLAAASSEAIYLALQAFFSTTPSLTQDGSDNITNTALEWHSLMHWATQPYSAADDYGAAPILEYILQLFQLGANTSPIYPPYWKNPVGLLVSYTQPEALAYMIYALRLQYKLSGYPAPVQVP